RAFRNRTGPARQSRVYHLVAFVTRAHAEEARAQIRAATAEDTALSGDCIVSQKLCLEQGMRAKPVTRALVAGMPVGDVRTLQSLAVAGG
ncbi:hypothetical protein, partial [Roseobacter sp.]|uniref:hypothetical protein n=1 Tax=Roseobacter sp. TaxID=1907202 RepID=UPI0025F06EE8